MMSSSNSSPAFSTDTSILTPFSSAMHRGRIDVHRLIERQHLPHVHQLAHDIGRTLPDQLGKLLHCHARRELDALPPWLGNLRRRAVMHVLAAVVRAAAQGIARRSCQRAASSRTRTSSSSRVRPGLRAFFSLSFGPSAWISSSSLFLSWDSRRWSGRLVAQRVSRPPAARAATRGTAREHAVR